MPYKGGKRKMPYKPRRRTRRRKAVNKIVRGTFPATYYARHTYVERFTLTQALNDLMIDRLFRCNSLYDPDYTGSGHQPLGFDEMAVIYDHYEVLGSKITVNFACQSTTELKSNIIVGIAQTDTTGGLASGNLNKLLENGHRCYKQLTDIRDCCKLSCGYSQRKTFGKHARGTDSQKGTNATNPTENSFFGVFAMATDATTIADPVSILVKIEYFAKWTERKIMSQS